MSRYIVSTLALLAAIVPSASFAGSGDAQVNLTISGFVPVICRAQLDNATVSLPDDGSAVQLGRLNEFCNSPGGYHVVVSYTGHGDLGALIVDGRQVHLDGSGRAVITESAGPAILSHELDYQPGKDAITSLNVTVETIGA